MTTNYLFYWKLSETRKFMRNGETLDYAASKQFASRHIKPGDRIWIVTGMSNHLELVGRIDVDAIVDRRSAMKLLGRDDLYGTMEEQYVLNKELGKSGVHRIALTDIAASLEFIDVKGKPAKSLNIWKIQDSASPRYGFGQALQSIRRINSSTADLLSERLAA